MEAHTALWKQLWDHDPNGLLVLDEQMQIVVVNPAFCRMFRSPPETLLGRPAAAIIDELDDFRHALATGHKVMGPKREYPRHELFARALTFAVPGERLVAGIFVDLTTEWKQEKEIAALRHEAVQEVRQVVDKQMRVAQEIAGLLGEATAETKVSLLHLLELLGKEKH